MGAVLYRFVVEGELGPSYRSAFEGMTIEYADGRTSIVGLVTDQSHLHGLLDRIARMGIQLVSVTPEPVVNGSLER